MEKNMSKNIIIFDTTLRDGEQSPGATMSLKEKIAIAELLDNMGVDVIEAGFSAASKGDMECIQAVSKIVQKATICSLARAIKSDIEAAAKSLQYAKKPRIHTFISTSSIHIEHQFRMTYEQVLGIIDETVRYAKGFCDDVEWSAMDATRSDMDFLIKAVRAAINAGAQTINIPDTVGYTLPDEYQSIIQALCNEFPHTIFSVHCHNDLGLATANSLAGIRGGARQVECTVNGIGERAGNAAMEEIVMAIKTRADVFGCDTNIDTSKIYPVSRFVSAVTGFSVQKNKAIVGANAFAHESGIHQDGMLKNRNTYEIMSPESVGVTKTQLVLGKHSGRAAIKNKIVGWGMHISDAEIQKIFDDFKALCDRKKHTTEDDLLAIVRNHQALLDIPNSLAQLISFDTKQSGVGHYTATVIIHINDQERTLKGYGDGPLDAIFKAINTIKTEKKLELVSFEAHSISHGTDAQAEAMITLKCEDKIYIGHARDTDTIMAAARAYLSAVNKILIQGGPHVR
jgi:2-isopropylmalate synthase